MRKERYLLCSFCIEERPFQAFLTGDAGLNLTLNWNIRCQSFPWSRVVVLHIYMYIHKKNACHIYDKDRTIQWGTCTHDMYILYSTMTSQPSNSQLLPSFPPPCIICTVLYNIRM